MSGVVKRLRELDHYEKPALAASVCDEAADKIEELQEVIDKAHDQLKECIETLDFSGAEDVLSMLRDGE